MPPVDIDRYFARIDYAGPRTPTLETLRALHAKHPVAIPFENLDVLRGVPIRLDAESLEKKLVVDRRGGYCFEQNGLFAIVLRALGFRVTTLSARVRWQVPPEITLPRSHMLLRVDLEDGPWIADVGFGGLTFTAPLRLDTEDPQTTPLETLRILATTDARIVQARIDDAWSDVYRFTLEEQLPIDYEVANWFTSTHPTSRFVRALIVTRPDGHGGRIVLRDRELTVRKGEHVAKEIVDDPDALVDVLAEKFDLRFPKGTRFGSPGSAWAS